MHNEVLFAHPAVQEVVMWTENEFTDQYGNTESETAIRIVMARDEAEKVNWGGLKDRVLVDHEDLFNVAELQYVHPAIQRALGAE